MDAGRLRRRGPLALLVLWGLLAPGCGLPRVRLYEGPIRPQVEIAVLEPSASAFTNDAFDAFIAVVDGEVLEERSVVEVLPGTHEVLVVATYQQLLWGVGSFGWVTDPLAIAGHVFPVEAAAGATYTFETDNDGPAWGGGRASEVRFRFWIEDGATGERVGDVAFVQGTQPSAWVPPIIEPVPGLTRADLRLQVDTRGLLRTYEGMAGFDDPITVVDTRPRTETDGGWTEVWTLDRRGTRVRYVLRFKASATGTWIEVERPPPGHPLEREAGADR